MTMRGFSPSPWAWDFDGPLSPPLVIKFKWCTMKTASVMLCGIILGSILGAAFIALLNTADQPGKPGASFPKLKEKPPPDRSEDVRRLQARIVELEEALKKSEKRAEPKQEPDKKQLSPTSKQEKKEPRPDLDLLLELADRKDSAGLAQRFEQLLLMGEEGYPILLAFLNALAQPPKNFFRDDRLAFALLSVAARHDLEAANFASYVLSATTGEKNSPLRGEFFRILPAFLDLHGDRFSGLKGELESALLSDLELQGASANLWKTFQSMKSLGIDPPLKSLENILGDQGRTHQHSIVIQQVANRNDPRAVETLARYIDASPDPRNWTVGRALQALGRMEIPEAEAVLNEYLASPVPEIRQAAILAHFSKSSDMNSFPLAVELLNSSASMSEKRRLISQLRSNGPEILESLRKSGGAGITNESVRQLIIKGPARSSRLSVPEGSGSVREK